MKLISPLHYVCLCALLACVTPFCLAEDAAWQVTIEDYFGGNNGTIITHEVSPTSIISYKSFENDDEPREKISEIDLNKEQQSSIVRAMNHVKIDALKKDYRPDQPIFDGTWVGFTFDLPERKPVQTTVYQGAYHRALKNIVNTMNKILPEDHRIRGMDKK